MNKKSSIISAIFVLCLGTLNHFIYGWLPYKLVGIFAPVNESIFEHLKLVFYPFLITIIIRYFKHKEDYYFLKASIASVSGILTIPLLYYLVNIFTTPPAFINISIFIIASILQEYVFYHLINDKFDDIPIKNSEGIIIIITISLAFSVFTFLPPKNDLFLDPISKTYGIYRDK